MELEARELGRLAIAQRSPLHYVERRVEQLNLADDDHYSVSVTQQVAIPFHAEGDAPTPVERPLLIPLGRFSKDRLPDLRVVGPDGSVLPLLSRLDRGLVGEALFTTRWSGLFWSHIDDPSDATAQEIWRTIQVACRDVVSSGRSDAYLTIYGLNDYLTEIQAENELAAPIEYGVQAVLDEDEFWTGLTALAESRALVARMRGIPGRSYVVNVNYTERFRYRGYSKTSAAWLVRKGLAWLGMIGIPIARSVANLGQAGSLWIIQLVPEGLEPLRCYWKKEGHVTRLEDPVSTDARRAVAERHQEPGQTHDQDVLLLDVQVSPSSAIAATIALAALLLVISTYVYQALPGLRIQAHDEDRTILVGLGSIFAAVPAGIAGALAYRGQAFVQRASRGPRTLLAALSAQAAFFAAVVSLKGLGQLAEAVAYILSVYSLIVIGVFLFIQLGPRWRKSSRSRNKSATELTSPSECRTKQIRDALIWVALWTLVVLVFARSQTVLQHQRFFTNQFPTNVWRAWWSWFEQ